MTQVATLQVGTRGPVSVAHLSGEIDLSCVADFGEKLAESVDPAALGLVVDLTDVTFMDSTGIHLLFNLAGRLKAAGQSMRVAVPESSPLRRILTLVNLVGAVPIDPSLDHSVVELATAHARLTA